MQLALTVLGHQHKNFIPELLPTIRDCNCNIMEIRTTRLAQAIATYLLVQGNWNQIAKLENALNSLENRLEIKVHSLRPETKERNHNYLPYSLETVSLDRANVVETIAGFLLERNIEIEEITGSCYQGPYIQSSVFSTKFILLVPPQQHLLSLREEFLEFCDQANIDAILEPIKR